MLLCALRDLWKECRDSSFHIFIDQFHSSWLESFGYLIIVLLGFDIIFKAVGYIAARCIASKILKKNNETIRATNKLFSPGVRDGLGICLFEIL